MFAARANGSVRVIEPRAIIEIAEDHPSLPGHFPGRPIVPGVVLLSRVVGAYCARHPRASIEGVPRVKFMSPLRPAERCEVGFDEATPGRVHFECKVGERVVARGSLVFSSR